MQLSPSQRAIVDVLRSVSGPLPLKSIAEAVRLAPSSTLRQLRLLEEEGIVAKTGTFHEGRYALTSHVSVRWSDLLRAGPRDIPLFLEWRSQTPVDWRFPLVSRVPDAPAQDTLYSFLDHAERRGYFTPWRCVDQLPGDEHAFEEPGKLHQRFGEETYHYPFTLVVYGSCARGDARRGSDLDLLFLYGGFGSGDFPHAYRRLWNDIAFQMAPGAARPINVLVATGRDLFGEKLAHLGKRIIEEGITVYASRPGAPWIEALRDGHADEAV